MTLKALNDAGSPSGMDNATATRLGYKSYTHNGSYNGGLAPNISYSSGGGTLTTVNQGEFVPYQMQDSTWRLRFNMNLTFSSVSRTGITCDVVGVVSISVTQSYCGFVESSNLSNAGGRKVPSDGRFSVDHATATTTGYIYSGDIQLASKPTWAY